MNTRDVLKAIRCCRDDFCTQCPLQKQICDVLAVPMESLPTELIERIENELEEKINAETQRNRHGT